MSELINNTTENIPKKNNFLVYLLIISLIFNLFFVVKIYDIGPKITGATVFTEPSSHSLIDNNVENKKEILHYVELRQTLEQNYNQAIKQKNLGIFIQDTETGSWIGLNEKIGFSPVSLLKVPIMMAILKKVELKEIRLGDIVKIKSEDIDTSYSNVYERKVGDEVTIEELLIGMITHSDNTAKNALRRQLSAYEIDDVFKHVGIPNPYIANAAEQTVSPRDYTRLFKALYYSTFLSSSASEFALKLTTNTQVENLITEGVPQDVEVAHKFGINSGIVLHDCGIVYHDKNPYFICIMTKGINEIESAEVIRKISRYAYEFVDSQ